MRSLHSYLPRFILLLLRTRLNSYKLSLLYIRASKAVSSVYHASSKSCTSMAEHTTACPRALLLTICIHHLLHLGIWGHDTPPTPVVTDSKKNYSLRTLIDSHRSNIHLTLFMSQKLVVASVPISITVFSLGSIIIRKTGLQIVCRVVHIIFLSYLFLLFSCFTMQSKRFLFSQTQSGIVLMKYDDIVVNVLPAPFPGFFEVRVFVQMAYLNTFLSYKFNMQKKNKSVTFLQFFFNHFSAASRCCLGGLFLAQLICRKK